MDFWIRVTQLILSLSILVVLHEFGHYIPAKIFKTRVEKFYLFFNWKFSLFKKKIGETEWGIGWIPLGGFVKISGMIDESMDKEQMAKPPKPWEFRSKPAWQRLIIMIGGVAVNVVIGFFLYIVVIAAWGEEYIENNQLKYGLAVHKQIRDLNIGLEDGDIITHIEGETVENINHLNVQIFLRGARKLEVLKSSGQVKTIVLNDTINEFMWKNDAVTAFTPRVPIVVDSVIPNTDAFSKGLMSGDSIVSINGQSTVFFHNLRERLNELKDEKSVLLGVYRSGIFKEIEIERNYKAGTIGFINETPSFLIPSTAYYSIGESISRGISKAKWTMSDYIAQLPLLFTSKGATSIGGFGAIGKLFPTTWNWQLFWLNTAFISLMLAIMNILPIPALDGGHILFLVYEIISGKKAPEKVLVVAQYFGFFLLIGLFIYANGNDVYKIIFG